MLCWRLTSTRTATAWSMWHVEAAESRWPTTMGATCSTASSKRVNFSWCRKTSRWWSKQATEGLSGLPWRPMTTQWDTLSPEGSRWSELCRRMFWPMPSVSQESKQGGWSIIGRRSQFSALLHSRAAGSKPHCVRSNLIRKEKIGKNEEVCNE